MELEFGKWYTVEVDGTDESVQFIHYDNDEETECTIDINGRWKHVNVDTVRAWEATP